MIVERILTPGSRDGSSSLDRTNHRNGIRELAWKTRAGRIDYQTQQLRKGLTGRTSWSCAVPQMALVALTTLVLT